MAKAATTSGKYITRQSVRVIEKTDHKPLPNQLDHTIDRGTEGADLNVQFCVAVAEDLTYTVSFQGTTVDLERNGVLSNIPSHITSGINCAMLHCFVTQFCYVQYLYSKRFWTWSQRVAFVLVTRKKNLFLYPLFILVS